MSLENLIKFFTSKKNLILILYCLILLFILGLFTSSYQGFIRNTLYQGVVNNVSALTEQGIARLQAIIEGHMRLMFSYKHYIEEDGITFNSPVPKNQQFYIDGILEHNGYTNTCIALKSGLASCYDGTVVDMSQNQCFSDSMKGKNCISLPYIDASGEKMTTLTAPLDFDNGTIGVLIVTANVKTFYNTFSIDFYEDKGYSYVIEPTGNMMIDSPRHPTGIYFSNLLSYLEESGNDINKVAQIRQDMQTGLSGVALIQSAGLKKIISYKPFDVSGAKLYFVAVVTEDVVLKNENMIMFYTTLLCIVATLAAMGVFLYIAINRRRQRQYVTRLAYYDNETGLYNKNYVDEYCRKLLDDKSTFGHNYASAVIDVNHFKVFNHMHGYEQGTDILKTMGEVFRDSVGQGEIAARISNDIFCVILKYDKQSKLVIRMKEMTEKIKKELKSNPNFINSRLTFACGLYMVQDRNIDPTRIFDNADIARQKTKNSGKSWITFFRQSMINQLKSEQAIEDIMEDALHNEEFEVYMQPKVDFHTLKVIGAESLVRWNRPGNGVVSPGVFIPVFERTGFVTQLDFFVFEKTCIALNKWRKEGKMLDVIVSVNMSRNHLGQDYFIDVLALIATRWDIPLHSLEIEITESAFFEDSEYLVKILNKLKAEGFRLSMDDFGAGYSSLNLLKSIPIDVLKIDKEFLDQSGVSEKSRIIIASIIHMAKSINVEVVCEGVETEEQATFLRNIGCDYAQGYLYSRPITLLAFEDFVRKINGEGSSIKNESYRYFYGANI